MQALVSGFVHLNQKIMKKSKKAESNSKKSQTMGGNISFTPIYLTQTCHLSTTVKDPIVFHTNSSMNPQFSVSELRLPLLTTDVMNLSRLQF